MRVAASLLPRADRVNVLHQSEMYVRHHVILEFSKPVGPELVYLSCRQGD